MNGIAAHCGQAGGVPIRERGVDVLRPRSLVPEGEERPGVLHVVGLVEDEGTDVAQSGQSNERGDERRNRCCYPSRCGRRQALYPSVDRGGGRGLCGLGGGLIVGRRLALEELAGFVVGRRLLLEEVRGLVDRVVVCVRSIHRIRV